MQNQISTDALFAKIGYLVWCIDQLTAKVAMLETMNGELEKKLAEQQGSGS